MNNPFVMWRKHIDNIKRYQKISESLQLILGQQPQNRKDEKKSIYSMSSDEFYKHITNPGSSELDQTVFYQFLFEYLVTGYLNGDISEQDIKTIIGMDNPLKINRYVDKMLRNIKMQGSLMEELMRYQNDPEKSQEIYSMILPEYAYDKEHKKLNIKNLDDVKDIIKDSAKDLKKEKKMFAIAKMQAEEKRRMAEWRKGILINSPEISELLGKDDFLSEDEKLEDAAQIIYTESEKQKRGTVIRRAANPAEHTVISNETDQMSPSELIAYKKKILGKLRKDMDQNNTGMDVKI